MGQSFESHCLYPCTFSAFIVLGVAIRSDEEVSWSNLAKLLQYYNRRYTYNMKDQGYLISVVILWIISTEVDKGVFL